MTAAKLTKKHALPVLRAIGQESYKGRKFSLVMQREYTVDNSQTMWDGGSKLDVWFLRVTAGRVEVVIGSAVLPECMTAGLKRVNAIIPPNCMIVERERFQGKDCGFRIIVGVNADADAVADMLGIPRTAGLLSAPAGLCRFLPNVTRSASLFPESASLFRRPIPALLFAALPPWSDRKKLAGHRPPVPRPTARDRP